MIENNSLYSLFIRYNFKNMKKYNWIKSYTIK